MIVALLALFVALGGSSYAALRINGRKLKNRSVAGKKLKKHTVTGKEVKNRSLRRRDFKAGQLPSGPTGATGATGAAGTTSVVMRKGGPVTVPGHSFKGTAVNCLPGEIATGGGAYNESQVYSMNVTSSHPLPNPLSGPATGNGIAATGWRVWMANNSSNSNSFQAYVMCASP